VRNRNLHNKRNILKKNGGAISFQMKIDKLWKEDYIFVSERINLNAEPTLSKTEDEIKAFVQNKEKK